LEIRQVGDAVVAAHTFRVLEEKQLSAMVAVKDFHNPKWYNWKIP
jgi:hypothetical protein